MQQLVLIYEVGDGCTFSCTIIVPIKYESAEQLAVDLEQFCKSEEDFITISGTTFESYDFCDEGVYYAPIIYTVDEWFAAHDRESGLQ